MGPDLDPRASTIQQRWIWEQGGGYFGVPLTNYLGWFFTVYVFFQLFALFVRYRSRDDETRALLTSHYAQAVLKYAVIGLTPVLTFLVGGSNTPVSMQRVWSGRPGASPRPQRRCASSR